MKREEETFDEQTVRDRIERLRQLAEQESNHIIAEAYAQSAEIVSVAWREAEGIIADSQKRGNKATIKESAKIIAEAKQKAEKITREARANEEAAYHHLSNMIKSGSVVENSYEQIDDLFLQAKRQLAKITKADPATADEMKQIVNQLEYHVESLVVDSLKLKSLESWLRRTTQLARRLRVKLDRK